MKNHFCRCDIPQLKASKLIISKTKNDVIFIKANHEYEIYSIYIIQYTRVKDYVETSLIKICQDMVLGVSPSLIFYSSKLLARH